MSKPKKKPAPRRKPEAAKMAPTSPAIHPAILDAIMYGQGAVMVTPADLRRSPDMHPDYRPDMAERSQLMEQTALLDIINSLTQESVELVNFMGELFKLLHGQYPDQEETIIGRDSPTTLPSGVLPLTHHQLASIRYNIRTVMGALRQLRSSL